MNPTIFDTLSAMHIAGFQLGKTIATLGLGFSIGKNIIRVVRGKIRGGVAMANVLRDAVIFFVLSYVGGALAGGAMKMLTGENLSLNFSMTNVGGTAGELSSAANDLINRVTGGVFEMMSSAGNSAGDTLTMTTAGTSMGGTVSAIVETFSTIGSMTGSATISAVPAVLFGAVIGVIYAFLFNK